MVHGIEISRILHEEALRAALAGLDQGCMAPHLHHDDDNEHEKNRFVLHLGAAQEFPWLLQQADIVFCYSTVWETAGFSQELGAIVLNQEWNELLSNHCRPGTIVITTDRCLDPRHGWKLLERLDVDNREVAGSTGYIQILSER
jgi:hypothetical protein